MERNLNWAGAFIATPISAKSSGVYLAGSKTATSTASGTMKSFSGRTPPAANTSASKMREREGNVKSTKTTKKRKQKATNKQTKRNQTNKQIKEQNCHTIVEFGGNPDLAHSVASLSPSLGIRMRT
jgi:hypothetical protein